MVSKVKKNLDLYSELWAPIDGAKLYNLEVLQSAFMSKVKGLQYIQYWDRLKNFKNSNLLKEGMRDTVFYIWGK